VDAQNTFERDTTDHPDPEVILNGSEMRARELFGKAESVDHPKNERCFPAGFQ
jgi:hypothetical protein